MTEENYALEQAKAQLSSIVEMVGALNVDYDRLEELKLKRAESGDNSLPSEEAEEFEELESQANGFTDMDEVTQTIQEDPLSLELRSGWYTPGGEVEAEEFCILLCTGGPAVRIIGELNNNNQPEHPVIEYQDWGTPWTPYRGHGHQDELVQYCQQFYFGE